MKRSLVAAVVVGLALSTAACGRSSSSAASAPPAPPASAAPERAAGAASGGTSEEAASTPVGPGCAAYAAKVPTGAGSVEGMAKDPLGVAASNNPMLTNLVAAVSGKLNPRVNLIDILNTNQLTVFAPVDAAFARVPAATLAQLRKDPALLTKVLTYHVLPVQVSPDKIVGEQKTVEGATVTVGGKPDRLTVNGVPVICGGVHTANATVYLIDGVLTPAS